LTALGVTVLFQAVIVMFSGSVELLSVVDEHGSVTAGAEATGVPYRVACKKIHEMEQPLGERRVRMLRDPCSVGR
jgi:molybdate transport repressor ModE-like protein